METSISPDRALDLVLANVPSPVVESCSLSAALARTLAQSVRADSDVPSFDRAMMDGFAVRAGDAGKLVRVVGEAAAGHGSSATVQPGTCIEIMTGAPCPAGCEAVVAVEQTQREGDVVTLPAELRAGQHVQERGRICRQGAEVLAPGDRITPLGVGVLASFGLAQVQVFARPRVGIVSTGDELVSDGTVLAHGQIRDSNGPMLAALARECGVAEVVQTHCLDTEESLRETLQSLAHCGIVVLTGGVSMGRYDLVPRVVEGLGAEPVFHKVTQKPGKPLFFARGPGRMLFGLPGNPRASHFCFVRYVASAVRAWGGSRPGPVSQRGVLSTSYESRGDRTDFVPMRADRGPLGGWVVTPFDERGSADIINVGTANVYVRFEAGKLSLAAGSSVDFTWMTEEHG